MRRMPVRQRLVGEIHVGEQRVAAARRRLARDQHRRHRRAFEIGRVRVPQPAEIDLLVLELDHRRDLRKSVEPLHERIFDRLAEAAARAAGIARASASGRGRTPRSARATRRGSPRWSRRSRSCARSMPRISAPSAPESGRMSSVLVAMTPPVMRREGSPALSAIGSPSRDRPHRFAPIAARRSVTIPSSICGIVPHAARRPCARMETGTWWKFCSPSADGMRISGHRHAGFRRASSSSGTRADLSPLWDRPGFSFAAPQFRRRVRYRIHPWYSSTGALRSRPCAEIMETRLVGNSARHRGDGMRIAGHRHAGLRAAHSRMEIEGTPQEPRSLQLERNNAGSSGGSRRGIERRQIDAARDAVDDQLRHRLAGRRRIEDAPDVVAGRDVSALAPAPCRSAAGRPA